MPNSKCPSSSPVILAGAFLRFTEGSFSPEQEELIAATVMLAEQSLGSHRQWHTLEASRFFELLPAPSIVRIEAAMYLMGFYGWLGITGAITPATCIDILDDIRESAPASGLLAELLRRAVPHLMADAA